MRIHETRLTLACLAVLFGATSSLHAVEIRNVTTNTQLFFDNFENLSITPSTVNAYDGSVDADPLATAGAWNALEGSGQGMIQVTTSTSSPDPVPFEGGRDLRVYRSAANNQQDLQARFPGNNPESTPGDRIHLEMMVYIPTSENVDARAQFILAGSTLLSNAGYSSARAWVYNNIDGFVHTVGPGESDSATAVPYLTNVWQQWTMDYVIGASTFTFSVAGVSGSGTSATSGNVYGAEIFNGNNIAGSFFLDAPEPASAVLLALGAAGMILRRRAAL